MAEECSHECGSCGVSGCGERTSAGPPLRVTARTDDGEVMAVEDAAARVFGVQFHPESVMTPDGAAIIANFLALV